MTFYVIDLTTGETQALQSPGFLFIHTLNAYDLNNSTLALEVSGVSQKGFLQQGLKSLVLNKTTRDASLFASQLKRYVLHLGSGTVDAEELKHVGTLALPRFNERMRRKKTCFVYGQVSHYNSSSYASTATVKLDTCRGFEAGRFYELAHYESEVVFVPRPGAEDEDDGVLVGLVYDGPSQQSYLNILDARSMHQVAKAYLPFFVPVPLHSNFFSWN